MATTYQCRDDVVVPADPEACFAVLREVGTYGRWWTLVRVIDTERTTRLSPGVRFGLTGLRDDGSLAIGEIAARPPGAHIVLANSYAHDADMYKAWARATVDGAFDGPYERKYAVGCAFLRGYGRGRVVDVRGVDLANERMGSCVVESKIPTRGTPKSDSYEGDGYVIVRDPDTEVVKKAMTIVIESIQVEYA